MGEVFDIHGGGLDLIFPHHENEIAQSRCAHGTDVMANVWMHNGFLQVEGQKMSKSLGNFVTINECCWTQLNLVNDPNRRRAPSTDDESAAMTSMLNTHYRQPIDWSRKLHLSDAQMKLATGRQHFRRFNIIRHAPPAESVLSLER